MFYRILRYQQHFISVMEHSLQLESAEKLQVSRKQLERKERRISELKLIQAIYVEAPDKSSGKRRQNIHIKYDGIGFIPLEKIAKKEAAWLTPRRPLKTIQFSAFFKITVLRAPPYLTGGCVVCAAFASFVPPLLKNDRRMIK